MLNPEKKQDYISLSTNGPFTQTQEHTPIASCLTWVAYRSGSAGTAFSLIPLDSKGKLNDPFTIQCTSLVTALDWSYFGREYAMLVVACSSSVSIYKFYYNDLAKYELADQVASKYNSINWSFHHPTVYGLCVFGDASTVEFYDYKHSKPIFSIDNAAKLQDFAFKETGDICITSGADNLIKLYDPRQSSSNPQSSFKSHDGVKPTKVLWIGQSDLIFSSGFNSKRNREYALFDIRNPITPLVMTTMDSSQGQLLPLFDNDTKMMFMTGKGESRVSFLEIRSDMKNPIETGGLPVNLPSGMIAGCCLVPKLALDVMQGEVARLLTVTNDSSIVAVKAIVPRKSYVDFHADIFPDTRSNEIPSQTIDEWKSGVDVKLTYQSLNPKSSKIASTVSALPTSVEAKNDVPPTSRAASVRVPDTERRANSVSLPKHSLYRPVLTTTSTLFEDFSPGNMTVPNESNGFEVSTKFFAFMQAGAGGRIGVWPLGKHGRLPVKVHCFITGNFIEVVVVLANHSWANPGLNLKNIGSDVNDFAFDPYNPFSICVACDDGKLRLFDIPPDGLDSDVYEAKTVLSAHSNKFSFILFHPIVQNMLLSVSPERGTYTAKLWDLQTSENLLSLSLSDQALAAAFDLHGEKLAIITKDKTLTIFNARTGQVLQQGVSHKGTKAARLIWLHGKGMLLSVGFGLGSQREIILYKEDDLSLSPLVTVLDYSPGIITPYFDMDTSVLSLYPRGESAVLYYEIGSDGGNATFLNRIAIPGGNITTAFATLPKIGVDVANVEIIRGLRSSQTIIESVSVTVPRIKKEYFQDDIFVETVDFDKTCIAASEWKLGKKIKLAYSSLHPTGMPKRKLIMKLSSLLSKLNAISSLQQHI